MVFHTPLFHYTIIWHLKDELLVSSVHTYNYGVIKIVSIIRFDKHLRNGNCQVMLPGVELSS